MKFKLPWKKRAEEAGRSAEKARLEYLETRAARKDVREIAHDLQTEAGINGWTASMSAIFGTNNSNR